MSDIIRHVYQFALPCYDNSNEGVDYADQLVEWSKLALIEAGGYTALGVREGVWMGDDGRIYSEPMQWYEVATDPETKSRLIRAAFHLFPDQQAFYVSEVGTAQIVERSDEAAGYMRQPPDISFDVV